MHPGDPQANSFRHRGSQIARGAWPPNHARSWTPRRGITIRRPCSSPSSPARAHSSALSISADGVRRSALVAPATSENSVLTPPGHSAVTETPLPSEYRGHPPPSHLTDAEHGNPDAVCDGRNKPTVTKAGTRSGNGMPSEANAGRRKARGSHNPPDRFTDQPERVLTEGRLITQRTL